MTQDGRLPDTWQAILAMPHAPVDVTASLTVWVLPAARCCRRG